MKEEAHVEEEGGRGVGVDGLEAHGRELWATGSAAARRSTHLEKTGQQASPPESSTHGAR